ncbi:undecaprenyl-phosphate galactose phosphotransferase WbaP [soil metagenome]
MAFRHATLESSLVTPDQPIALRSGRTSRRRVARDHAATYAWRRTANGSAVALVEAVAFASALFAATVVTGAVGRSEPLGTIIWAVVAIYALAAAGARLYPGWGLGAAEELRRMTYSQLGAWGAVVVGAFLIHAPALEGARTTLVMAVVFSLIFVPLVRVAIKRTLIRRDKWGVAAVIYGAGPAGAQVVRLLQEERGMGFTPAVVLDDDPECHGEYLDSVPIAGGTQLVVEGAPVAVLAMPEQSRETRVALLEGPLAAYRKVVLIPDFFEIPSLWVRPRDLAGVLGLELTATLASPTARATKRGIDLAIVLLTAPVWVLAIGFISILIWLEDRSSPFYTQQRIGRVSKRFGALKLRTMVPNAEEVLQQALEADPALRAEWEQFFKLERDPRITRVGRLLRKTSLDELPQLINVLRGEMSLVGPRPLPAYHHEELPARVRELRERVHPGITGLWQVSGRSDLGNEGIIRWDGYYVRNWSPWLDLVILIRTIRVVFRGSGAY